MFGFKKKTKPTTATTFDDTDWAAFGGAESWDDQHPPLTRELAVFVMIADKNQIAAMNVQTGDMLTQNVQMPNSHMATMFLNGLSHTLTEQELIKAGFEQG